MANRYWTDNPDRKIHADGPRPGPYKDHKPSIAPFKSGSWSLRGAPTQPGRSKMGCPEIKVYNKVEGMSTYGAGGKVKKVMHEFKAGKLHSGSKKGPLVKSRAQAVAIGMSEQRNANKKK